MQIYSELNRESEQHLHLIESYQTCKEENMTRDKEGTPSVEAGLETTRVQNEVCV